MSFGLTEDTVNKIRGVFAQYPQVTEVILYGSRAKGTHHNGSDIDLALKGVKGKFLKRGCASEIDTL